jgi:hypothetical protein
VDHLTKLERAVLEKLLAGDLPALVALRSQVRSSRIVERRMTGVGFFTTFAVPPEVPRVQGSFQLGDVSAEIEGLSGGAGFILWVNDGVLDMLEGYTIEGPWPEEIREFSLE